MDFIDMTRVLFRSDSSGLPSARRRREYTQDQYITLCDYFGRNFDTIPQECPKGLEMTRKASALKLKAKGAASKKRFDRAIQWYRMSLEIFAQINDTDQTLAEILYEKSNLLFQQRQYRRACEDAKICVLLHPQWYKGRHLFIRCLRAFKDFESAYAICLDNLNYPIDNNELVQVISTLLMTALEFDDLHSIRNDVPRSKWQELLDRLMNDDHWATLKDLVIGFGAHQPVVNDYRATCCNLAKLISSCKTSEWKRWGEKLCIQLLIHGARYQSMCKHGKYGLHAALKMGIKTGTYDLLKHILSRIIPSGDRDRVDANGDTLLHVACRGKYSSKLDILKYLLDLEFNPKATNGSGETALNILRRDERIYQPVLTILREKGICDEDDDATAPESFKLSSLPETKNEPLERPTAEATEEDKPVPVEDESRTGIPKENESYSIDMVDAGTAGEDTVKDKHSSTTESEDTKTSTEEEMILSVDEMPTVLESSEDLSYPADPVGMRMRDDPPTDQQAAGQVVQLKDSPVGDWSKARVTKWFNDISIPKIPGLDGSLLVELSRMQRDAPEFFFHTLEDISGMSFTETLTMSSYLRTL